MSKARACMRPICTTLTPYATMRSTMCARWMDSRGGSWVQPLPLQGMAPRRYERIASAGPAMGILEPLLVRAYLHAGAALPQTAFDQEETFGRHQGGATYLLEEGVAEHVVKADVASLYPSLMRAFRIGPSCDHLGVFLHLIDRLTELRLFHKAAARSAPTGSIEADEHEGTQAAMKTMINAAYGYMGATSMALFGDLGAANEVTRRGRALLDKIIEALRERGMVPIEADTDGVYFATPTGVVGSRGESAGGRDWRDTYQRVSGWNTNRAMPRWCRTQSKTMPYSPTQGNCSCAVRQCAPAAQNRSACASCSRRSAAPC